MNEIRAWLEGGPYPTWLETFPATSVELKEVEENQSSIYRGPICLVVLTGARDFNNEQPAVLGECQEDHIFPKAKYVREPWINRVLNRTLISTQSNQIKSAKHPSEYLPLFLEKHGGNETNLYATFASHLISAEAVQAMKHNDFAAFIKAREATFQQEIARRVKGE
ncbi:MAG: hypothetical protein N3A60_10720 [Thermanaerothrix sp.]|nr:hypothetical protein [Thermanaerothrix sp.]